MQALGEAIMTLYLRFGYGRAPKQEIDAVVFHHVLLQEYGEGFDYAAIDKARLYDLSLRLKVTQARIKKLLEDDYYLYAQDRGSEGGLAALLLALVNHQSITKESLKEGKLRLFVANPIVKQRLEVELYRSGGVADFLLNRDIMVIDIYDFLKLLHFTEDARIAAIIRTNLLAKTQVDKAPEVGVEIIGALIDAAKARQLLGR
jgi:hypothetical protein